MKAAVRFFAVAASVAALGAWAQDDDFDFDSDDGASVGAEEESQSGEADEVGEGEEAGAKKPAVPNDRIFFSLPFCRTIQGSAEVKKPGDADWQPVEEGKFYPHGAYFRTTGQGDSKLTIQFGGEVSVVVSPNSEFGTRIQPVGAKERTITLQGGIITLKLPRNMPEGLFKVATPSFTVVNPQGESRYAYVQTADGDATQIRCVTGSLAIEGRHFRFPGLRAAQEVKIRSTRDELFTGLYGNRGDCLVILEQGDELERNFETGETKVVQKTLDWKLSPKTKVCIHRAKPAIGDRMSVSIMTFNANGDLKNRRAFAEGRYEINSGEIGPRDESEKEKLAKQVAEAADAAEVDISVEETSSEEAASSDGDGDGGDAGSSSVSEDDFEF